MGDGFVVMAAQVKWPTWLLGTPDFVHVVRAPLPCTSAPEAFHRGGTTTEEAAALCAGCGFVVECAAYALADARLSGTWGGTTEVERRRVRAREAERRRRAAKAA